MNDVMVDEKKERDADRLLLCIYILSDARPGVPVSRDEIVKFVTKHRIFQMSNQEFFVWQQVHLIPVFKRAQSRKPQA
jgi:hypothetical protein